MSMTRPDWMTTGAAGEVAGVLAAAGAASGAAMGRTSPAKPHYMII